MLTKMTFDAYDIQFKINFQWIFNFDYEVSP